MVSIIIPCLNEEEPIADVVRECLATGIAREVLVVDNGSTDADRRSVPAAAGARVVQPTCSTRLRARVRGGCRGGRIRRARSCSVPRRRRQRRARVDGSRLVAPVADGTQDFVIGSRTRGEREPGSMNTQQIFAGSPGGVAHARALQREIHGHVPVPRHPPRRARALSACARR